MFEENWENFIKKDEAKFEKWYMRMMRKNDKNFRRHLKKALQKKECLDNVKK